MGPTPAASSHMSTQTGRARWLHGAGRHSTPSGHSVMCLETKGLVGETKGGTQHITAPPFQAPPRILPGNSAGCRLRHWGWVSLTGQEFLCPTSPV